MYSSRGSGGYGQQSYGSGGQSGYSQNLGAGYAGGSVSGPEGGSQHSLSSRHSSMLSASQETDIGSYRGSAAHYGSQYNAIYGSSSLSGSQQAPAMSTKGAGPSGLEGRGGYASALPDSPKFASSEYFPSSSHGYDRKSDRLYSEKLNDYPASERRHYGERQSAYVGRDIQSDLATRYTDSVGFSRQLQSGLYERIEQESILRQEQLLKSQSMQSTSIDGASRQADYLASRGVANCHSTQDLNSYGGRIDAEPRSSSMLTTSSYSGQHAPSILGAAPRRNLDDLLYTPSSSNPGYGVSLPPGRDYGSGKGLHGTSLDSDYRAPHLRSDDLRVDRASYLREFELREEERRREDDRRRELLREMERERERDRERERERKRERECIMERCEKEKEQKRKRELVIRRKRTPPRVSRDRRGPSLTKEARTLRLDEASHRRHSPIKEKRREYVCKIHASSLVETERDFLSLDKRYPRLFVSPEFSKVVENWPKGNLKLSMHTPVSFEHDFVEDEGVTELKDPLPTQLQKSEHRQIVWNAKIILMSGLSKNALEELSSERSYDDHLPHFCNILRFAILKRDRSFMAIGGPWETVDGGDPSVDDSVLAQTALRYAKDVAQIDLKNCCNWNRFMEIHYDRYGKDGFFSHKEITVLFVPDLSECLPSLDAWREQWLAHRKAVAERERKISLRKERAREKEGQKGKGANSSKDSKRVDKSEKSKESASPGTKKNEKDRKREGAAQKGDSNDKNLEKKEGTEIGEKCKNVDKEQGDGACTQTSDSVKTGKKKIIRRVVKQKVSSKNTDAENTISNQNESLGVKDAGDNTERMVSGEQNESSALPSGAQTLVSKKVIKKVPLGKTSQNKEKGLQNEVKVEKETDSTEDKPKDNTEINNATVVQGAGIKTAVKKKIIRRVVKKKLTGTAQKDGNKAQGSNETGNMANEQTGAESLASDAQKSEKEVTATSTLQTVENQASVPNSYSTEFNTVNEGKKKDDEVLDEKDSSGNKNDVKVNKQKLAKRNDLEGKRERPKGDEKLKDDKKDKDEKTDSMSKSAKDVKEKRITEEPPRHPGLILKTNVNKETKLRSLSLSLDSLLDYADNDIEETTFELSLFAESFYEMLQYQMGSRILAFLQKLRIIFVNKRNHRKRLREEMEEKDKERKSSAKRLKTNELPMKTKSADSELVDADKPDEKKTKGQETVKKEEDTSVDKADETKLEEETDYEEDPEEDPEEDEEIEDSGDNLSNEKNEDEKMSLDDNQGAAACSEKVKTEDDAKETKCEEAKPKSDVSSEKQDSKSSNGKKESTTVEAATVDKELLQAFRFFDRNRMGYIRVEDMRLIIHNLGKFLSHRDVKELVQSALLESNTGRDDHILYGKLARMTNILADGF